MYGYSANDEWFRTLATILKTKKVVAPREKGTLEILNHSTIVDMMSYMRALSVFNEGDSTKVIVDRNGKQIEVDLKF